LKRNFTTVRRAGHIRSAALADSTIILDLRSGRYGLLNATATRFWNALNCASEQNSVEKCLLESDVDDQVVQDFDRFISMGIDRGLLIENGQDILLDKPLVRFRGHIRLLKSKAFLAICVVRFGIRFFGFSAVYSNIQRLSFKPSDMIEPGHAERAELSFLAAESFFPPPTRSTDCLPRSLAFFLFLKFLGLPAKHLIGVRHTPLLMHAWVESEGRVWLGDKRSTAMLVLNAIE
jgi:hypothetical protein